MTTSNPMADDEARFAINRQRSAVLRPPGHRSPMIGAGDLLLLMFIADLAPLITWHDPCAQELSARRIPPLWPAWFYGSEMAGWLHSPGADPLGRDYLTRLIYGARISIFVG